MKKKATNLFQKLEPADLIAFLVIAGVLFLNWKGIQTMLSAAASIVIGYYFGRKLTQNGH